MYNFSNITGGHVNCSIVFIIIINDANLGTYSGSEPIILY